MWTKRPKQDLVSAEDIGLQSFKQGSTVSGDNRGTLTSVLKTARLFDWPIFLQPDENVPNVHAINSALDGNLCMIEARLRSPDDQGRILQEYRKSDGDEAHAENVGIMQGEKKCTLERKSDDRDRNDGNR
jgi:hypothetical protein